jgi:hypothetical protein
MVKPHGFVLDFVGIFDKLERALRFDSDEINAIDCGARARRAGSFRLPEFALAVQGPGAPQAAFQGEDGDESSGVSSVASKN